MPLDFIPIKRKSSDLNAALLTEEVYEMFRKENGILEVGDCLLRINEDTHGFIIESKENTFPHLLHIATIGDYLITDGKSQIWSIAPEVFRNLYEEK